MKRELTTDVADNHISHTNHILFWLETPQSSMVTEIKEHFTGTEPYIAASDDLSKVEQNCRKLKLHQKDNACLKLEGISSKLNPILEDGLLRVGGQLMQDHNVGNSKASCNSHQRSIYFQAYT